ncbi:MAG: site-specific DNA-methyltransferase, partial [Anaerolineales bacterium]
MNYVYFGDNLHVLAGLDSESVDLIYVDPPFNTGKYQKNTQIRVRQSANGDRKGFQGQLYETIKLSSKEYKDQFGDEFISFLEPRLKEAYRTLTKHGALYFHMDYREVHYCRILLDKIFGPDCFLNEIIWAYDYGGKSKTRWAAKHENILVYVKDPSAYVLRIDAATKYLKQGRAAPWCISAADVWWHTIVPTNSKERTGYPTQKPINIINSIVLASSEPGDVVMDFFAGSGTT